MAVPKIAPEKFGRDHWSLLGYIETVCVDCAGFEVGYDPRMRQFKHSIHGLRLALRCPYPKRSASRAHGLLVDDLQEAKYGTRLNDDTSVPGHDDWDCVHDLMRAGYFTTMDEEQIDGGEVLHLSLLGIEMANQIRYHKSNGGSFATFKPKISERPLGEVA